MKPVAVGQQWRHHAAPPREAAISIDYDAPRVVEEIPDGIAELRPRPRGGTDVAVDPGEDLEELLDPAALDLDDELLVRVIPRQADEFVCACCFLIHHRSRIGGLGSVCADCA